MTATTRNARRVMIGTVRSSKMTKTITVEVQRTFKHAKYGKYLRKRKRYMAHDEKGEANAGDLVEITATRAMSKNKRWRLVRVLTRSQLGGVDAHEEATEIMAEVTGRGEKAQEAGS